MNRGLSYESEGSNRNVPVNHATVAARDAANGPAGTRTYSRDTAGLPGGTLNLLTGARKEEFYSHVWGHYARLDPWYAGPAEERNNQRAALKPLPPQR